ncbi:SDR family oxidoreductase [Daejeonella sp.]|uniref:SDR family NAD(P)-dependent oxidoreductase n=1 Tax=Daejeonella sp. TaxID=2805397 RepID=UPI002D1A2BB2|nr:SDR family oxidoreductase [Daejeonella sp.]HQT24933.1 SDR family oxidoreductase [Daejeonella sp.]HQT58849.1 SDR family oxidoreductase [Daejeonella sp.]
MKISFEGKTVLVTGSTRGIGKKIVEDIHELGGSVIITGTNPDQIKELSSSEGENSRKTYFCVDFSSISSINDFLAELDEFDKIDVLINNAGINRLNSIQDIEYQDWLDMMSVNLTGPALLMKSLSVKMQAFGYGRIVNIASIFSKVSKERRSVYSATKFGLNGLTVGISNDLARYNILVNTVSPGFIMTDLTRKNLSSEEIDQLTLQIPAKRMGQPEDISRVVAFLASDLNSYITGQNIVVDGGFVNV